MSSNALIQKIEQELSLDVVRRSFVVEQVLLYLTEQGANLNGGLAEIIASKLDRSCLRSTFDIITNCSALAKAMVQHFYGALKSSNPPKDAEDDLKLKARSQQFASIATSAMVQASSTFQLPRMNVERESARLIGQYAKYLELVKGMSLADAQALESVRSIDLTTLRSEVSAKLLEPIVGQPNGLFNNSLGCGTKSSVLPKPVANSTISLITARAVLDSKPAQESKLRSKTGKFAILGAHPSMSSLIKEMDIAEDVVWDRP